jgi:hypothetical protein
MYVQYTTACAGSVVATITVPTVPTPAVSVANNARATLFMANLPSYFAFLALNDEADLIHINHCGRNAQHVTLNSSRPMRIGVHRKPDQPP